MVTESVEERLEKLERTASRVTRRSMNLAQKIAAAVTLLGMAGGLSMSCSKAGVEIVEKQTSAYYLGYIHPGSNQWEYKWLETCVGIVTNKGNRTAFEVRVSAQFSSGHRAEALIDQVNLAPGEVGNFRLYGDTLVTHSSGQYINPKAPSVTASVSVRWE